MDRGVRERWIVGGRPGRVALSHGRRGARFGSADRQFVQEKREKKRCVQRQATAHEASSSVGKIVDEVD
jgi:hypothetical protein